ncbi:hypothetical protein HN51_023270 [Arachis hypogaea]|nr:uncharacterized protein DS421_2g58990 [Arachis hypogaea]
MASFGCSSAGLVLQRKLAMFSNIFKGSQQLLPSVAWKPEIVRYQYPCLSLILGEKSRKSQNEWLNLNQFANVDFTAQRPMLVDSQETFPNTIIFSFDIDECQQLFTPLSYHIGVTLKPLLDVFQDPALSSKIQVHPDGQVTFLGSAIQMKEFLSPVAELYLSQTSNKGEKQSILVPHFSRLIMNMYEAETRSHSSTMEIHSTITVPLRSPERVKAKPLKKKNKKVATERDLYKKNYLYACESLLSLMVDKRQHRKTAIISLKKSCPELPHLMTQFSVGIAVLLSVIYKLACGRVPFCTSKLLNTGFGFGLVWLSWAVSKQRDTIINISKNAGKLGLKDEGAIRKVDKSVKEVYFRAVALLALAILRLA